MTEKTFKTDRGDIRYWVNAFVPGRSTLVFLPGLTADHRLFDRQIEHFEPDWTVIVWDAPGHAASRPFTLDFALMDKAVWLHKLLTSEGVERPVLIGQSMGGYVSQCIMERYPGYVAGFVSIDTAPIQKKYLTASELWIMKHTGMIYRPYPWKSLLKAGANGCAETAYGRQLMRDMMSIYSKDDYCKLVCHGYDILAAAIEADLPYTVDCPALLLCGEYDKAGYTKRYNLAWAKTAKLPLTMIPNAGHNSNTDQPQAVNDAIDSFLAEHGLSQSGS